MKIFDTHAHYYDKRFESDVEGGADAILQAILPDPGIAQRMAILMKQVQLTASYKGERVALLEARKHTSWYLNGMRGAAKLRREAGTLTTLEDLAHLCARVIQMDEEGLL